MKIILQKGSGLSEDQLNELRDLGYSIEVYADQEVEGDIYLGYPPKDFTALDNIKGLKLIQALMAGFDHIDFEAIKNKGVVYTQASGVSHVPISEYVVLKMLDFSKDAQTFRDNQEKSYWSLGGNQHGSIRELYNRKVLVLGTGHIGKEIAKRLQAFEMEVIGINSSGRDVQYFDKTYPLSELSEHLGEVDFVVGALPLNEATTDIYNKDFFLKMKKDGVFINVGRGLQLVEDDLLEIIDDHLAAVYLDVVPTEPLGSDSKLWSSPKIFITPHVAASSDYISVRLMNLIKHNLKALNKEGDYINRVV